MKVLIKGIEFIKGIEITQNLSSKKTDLITVSSTEHWRIKVF